MTVVTKPTLILNEQQVKANIAGMSEKAKVSKVTFRPHFKTHQSKEIGSWFRTRGVTAITVSSFDMAEYFINDGWNDITVAIPVNPRAINRINNLTERVKLELLVDSETVVAQIGHELTQPTGIWIKIDVGYHRCGLQWYNTDSVLKLADKIQNSSNLSFQGLLTHAGHTYHQSSAEVVLQIHNTAVQRMMDLQRELNANSIDCRISIGDTPGCSLATDFSGVDEIRPGNFVFNDLMQLHLGACQSTDLALAMACPVIGKYASRGEIVLNGGAVHLSKEYLKCSDGKQVYGYLADGTADGWGAPVYDAPVISLSQEHGIVQLPQDHLERIEIGGTVIVLPVHACLAANLHPEYLTTSGCKISRFNSLNRDG